MAAVTPPTPATPRKRLTSAERREHFLDMAAEIVAEQGVSALTMEGVAARAGVNKALGYRYFANSDALLVALFERETEAFDLRINEAIEPCTTLDEQLRALVDVYLDSVTEGALIRTLEQPKRDIGPFEERRIAREHRGVDRLALLLRSHYHLSRKTATTAAAVFATGMQGLIGVWLTTGWSRAELVDRYVTMAIGSMEALETEASAKTSHAAKGKRRR
jgi:AcrR family transcriptional regulator